MEGDEAWLLRPVARNMCLYESIVTPGKLSLRDIALMNEYLDMEADNNYRIAEARRMQDNRR